MNKKKGYKAGFLAGSTKLKMFDGALDENGFSIEYIKNYKAGFIDGFNSVSLEINKYSEGAGNKI